MAQNEHLREANELADLIQRRVGQVHPGPSRGVKQAGFRVLVTAFMPAVLVEIGFGTNPAEAAYMSNPAKMDELSAAIADAVLEYLKRYERRVSARAAHRAAEARASSERRTAVRARGAGGRTRVPESHRSRRRYGGVRPRARGHRRPRPHSADSSPRR